MSVSIIDIATLAGVSKSTVSAVINNSPNVRPSTRERVLQAIDELDYHPNLAARELVASSPLNIGIIMPSYKPLPESCKENHFSKINEGSNLELVSTLAEQVSRTKYGLLIEHTVIDGDLPALPDFALSRRVAGIFQISPMHSLDFVDKLRKYVPAVIEIGALHPQCDSVYSDFFDTVKRSVDYLADAGHERIAFINCDPASRTFGDRRNGYVAGIEGNALTFDEGLIRNSTFTGLGGYRAIESIWNGADRKPTALICASGTIACGALRFFHENGIAIPDDLSIVCNSDGVLTEFAIPRLTSIARDKSEVAQVAFSLMMDRLSDPSRPVRAVKVKDRLAERDSVKRIHKN